jgi:xylulokinase
MYLGIDLGTSGVKAVVIDAAQRVVASAGAPLAVMRQRPGWSEQAPADWIGATEHCLEALRASNPAELAAVRGVGLSGQMHGATLLGAADEVLRPAILWNDTRSQAEAAALDADPRFRAKTGNIVFPGFTAPKLVWVSRNEASIFRQVRRVLLPKDFLRLWLTGEAVSEMSDASGTAWLDVALRRWSEDLLAAGGMELRQMPRLVEGTAPSGTLRGALSARYGMRGDVVVAGGAGDNAASACGMGAIGAGSAFVSLGTSGVLFAANDAFRPNPGSAVHAFCHALPDAWHQMGVILSATDSLNWLAGVSGVEAAALVAEAGEDLASPGEVLFLPYLSGERTPHNDAGARGCFAGLSHVSDRRALTRAVLEGVAFAFRDCLDALKEAGTRLTSVTAVGGGSRSPYWLHSLATALGLPVEVPADGDFGAAFGAARLGLIAAEGADPRAICTPPAIARTIDPDAGLAAAYEDAFRRYKALYPALRNALA